MDSEIRTLTFINPYLATDEDVEDEGNEVD